jgi:hypothetical protein
MMEVARELTMAAINPQRTAGQLRFVVHWKRKD